MTLWKRSVVICFFHTYYACLLYCYNLNSSVTDSSLGAGCKACKNVIWC